MPTSLAPASRTLLKDRAYDALKEAIQSGVFAPNAFLSERQLAERLGMSKTPIRAALERLEAQGLVAVSPQQGIVVKELSAREVGDLFDMRAAIEPFVARRLAERGVSADAEARLRDNLERQGRAAEAADARDATRLDVAFHALLAEILDNREALAWLARCFDKLHRSILRVNDLGATQMRRSLDDHAAVAAAISAGDAAAAAGVMAGHLDHGRRILLGG